MNLQMAHALEPCPNDTNENWNNCVGS
ncbi:uncharacterized protein METZ01_LOCUS444450, partial [marine metagenome]